MQNFLMKISFHSYANKTNFHVKSFALSLAFIKRFTATRKWPIQRGFQSLRLQARSQGLSWERERQEEERPWERG